MTTLPKMQMTKKNRQKMRIAAMLLVIVIVLRAAVLSTSATIPRQFSAGP